MSEPEWKEEYDTVLEQIAATDKVEKEWPKLRDIIKSKLQKNIEHYLKNPPPDKTPLVTLFAQNHPRGTPNGGLKLPPFRPRTRLEGNPNEAPKHVLTETETNEFRDIIFKLLDDFEGPPFTIQRVCELCSQPTKHYKFIGKYLRAVEKSLLVTSTWDAFPPSTTPSHPRLPSGVLSSGMFETTPSTPLFSPIPFLHGDARRSQSRSPPPSPLALTAVATGGSGTEAEEKALGLVDELDDPSPGHLSDHLQPISSTTTPAEPHTNSNPNSNSRPMIPSLGDRFVSTTVQRETDSLRRGPAQTRIEGRTQGQMDREEEENDLEDSEDSEDKENKAA